MHYLKLNALLIAIVSVNTFSGRSAAQSHGTAKEQSSRGTVATTTFPQIDKAAYDSIMSKLKANSVVSAETALSDALGGVRAHSWFCEPGVAVNIRDAVAKRLEKFPKEDRTKLDLIREEESVQALERAGDSHDSLHEVVLLYPGTASADEALKKLASENESGSGAFFRAVMKVREGKVLSPVEKAEAFAVVLALRSKREKWYRFSQYAALIPSDSEKLIGVDACSLMREDLSSATAGQLVHILDAVDAHPEGVESEFIDVLFK
jgi:hypothetical protein